MKRHLFAFLTLVAVPALATSPFDGTWVWDTNTAELPTRPDIYVLDKGTWHCKSCVPEVQVSADGKSHRVTGQSLYDAVAITVANTRIVKITVTKGGKLAGRQTLTVSDDGKHLTHEQEDHSASKPMLSRVQAERVANGPAGSHAVSGSWRQTKIDSVSENASTVILKVTADGISFKDLNGTGYEAKFDGKDYPMTGDINETLVSVRLIDERTFEETAKRDGKVESVIRLQVSSDGKTAQYVAEDKRQGTTTRGMLHKKM
jgi:hypothetical protein